MALALNQVNYKDSSSWTSLIDMVYPKGSIFLGYNLMNKNDTSSDNHPGKLFGGGWLPIENKMLRSGWGGATGGADRHQHVLASTSGRCAANIGASGGDTATIGYQADHPAWTMRLGNNGYTDSNKNTYGKYAYIPKNESEITCDKNISAYTVWGVSGNNSTREMNHGVRLYGFTGNSGWLPAYQTVNTWYRTS